MRAAAVLVLAVVIVGLDASAKCLRAEVACRCDGTPHWIVKVNATSSTEGTVTEVFTGAPVPDAGSPPGVGASISFGSFTAAKAGDVVLVDDTGRGFVMVDDGKTARCANVDTPTDDWARAVADGTCGAVLSSHGFEQPDCNDHGLCMCSSGSGVTIGALLLVANLLRRYHDGKMMSLGHNVLVASSCRRHFCPCAHATFRRQIRQLPVWVKSPGRLRSLRQAPLGWYKPPASRTK